MTEHADGDIKHSLIHFGDSLGPNLTGVICGKYTSYKNKSCAHIVVAAVSK